MRPRDRWRSPLRARRLKAVFQGRKAKLQALWDGGLPVDPHAYSRAVIKYTQARIAWRAYRGY